MRIPVGILGATGLVGKHYLSLLADHPWFEVTHIAASEKSAGKTLLEAVPTAPASLANLPLQSIKDIQQAKKNCRLIFSAVGSDAAKQFEESYAAAGLAVISNASCHRDTADVPMIIPEINPEHLEWLPKQQKARGWAEGFIVTKPNCTIQCLLLPLAPLHHVFKATQLSLTTMQAISGAGYPGIPALDIVDVVSPFIEGEEEKLCQEPLKILGCEELIISAQCNRIPTRDGHFIQVAVKFAQRPTQEQILALWDSYKPLPQLLHLPSAPERPVVYVEGPETQWDLMRGDGMSVSVGQLKPCVHLDFSFLALSHNVIRGAAGGGVLTAELLVAQNYLKGF